jgi:hypothetical protein
LDFHLERRNSWKVAICIPTITIARSAIGSHSLPLQNLRAQNNTVYPSTIVHNYTYLSISKMGHSFKTAKYFVAAGALTGHNRGADILVCQIHDLYSADKNICPTRSCPTLTLIG